MLMNSLTLQIDLYALFVIEFSKRLLWYWCMETKRKTGRQKQCSSDKRIPCYVSENSAICPICNQPTHNTSVRYVFQNHKKQTIKVQQCVECEEYVISYSEFKKKGEYINCLNNIELKKLISQDPHPIKVIIKNDTWCIEEDLDSTTKNNSKQNKGKGKKAISPRKMDSYNGFHTYCEFVLYNPDTEQRISVSIQDIEKSKIDKNQWILTNRSTRGMDCFKAIANSKNRITLDGKDYKIKKIQVFDTKYIERYRETVAAYINSGKNRVIDFGLNYVDVHVYFKLNNSCMNSNHPIETVTMRSKSSLTGKIYQVNAFFCQKCGKYFINNEAVRDLISCNKYPSFHYILKNDNGSDRKPLSVLKMYGYNAGANGPSDVLRHNILKWIIDNGIMNKPEIIKDIQDKIYFNGKKAGNEAAKLKWMDDIEFLNSYVADNKRVVYGRLNN